MRRARSFVLWLALCGCAGGPELAAPPAGAVSFAALGDTPYSQAQAARLNLVIDELNAAPLGFVVHLGDITSGEGPCGDAWLLERRRQFERIRRPFVLLPGDNEWTDCHRNGYDPLERLARWRALFCSEVALPGFVRQPAVQREFGAFCEHARWTAGGAVFVALNISGTNNNFGRSPEMDAEYTARMQAVHAWLEAAVDIARQPGVTGLVVLMHANPGFAGTHPPGRFDGFQDLRRSLAAAVAQLGKPVLLVHGDSHTFRDDRPLPGLRRVEVWGAPEVRWIAITLYPGGGLEIRD